MGEIVNLKWLRKRKAREDKDARAAANRARFGQTKEARQRAEAEADLAARQHEGHKREE